MYCPLKVIAYNLVANQQEYTGQCDCDEETCAWFDDFYGECGIKVISKVAQSEV